MKLKKSDYKNGVTPYIQHIHNFEKTGFFTNKKGNNYEIVRCKMCMHGSLRRVHIDTNEKKV